jgi:hypothetical protein
LFEDRLDDTIFSSRGWYDNTRPTISTSEHVRSSTDSVELRYRAGASLPDSGGEMRMSIEESEELYVSYYLNFAQET